MILPRRIQLCLFPATLLGVLLLVGCPAGETMDLKAGNCWGTGAEDCRSERASALRALGYEGLQLAAMAADLSCGAVINCAAQPAATVQKSKASSLASASVPTASSRPPASPKNVPSSTPPAAGQAASEAAPVQASTVAKPTAVAETPAAKSEPEQVAALSSSSGSCAGIDIAALEDKSALSGAEKSCAMDAAMGRAGVSEPEVQVAVISLYNSKATGWQKAVEAALSRKNLANAPNLNLAGIKPAYDGKQYATVIKRADIVWRNLSKGYALSGEQRTFLTEFACRSALQLHLMQKPHSRGFDWCERWRSRVGKAGGSTSEVDDILDQLED